MPLLLNVMQNANGPEYRKLRVKSMECAGLIGSSPSPALLLLSEAESFAFVRSHRRRA